MLFTNKKITNVCMLKLENNLLEQVHVTKFLGTYIDDQLSWKEHINKISEKLAKSCSIIYKVRNILDFQALKSLYCTLFLPYLSHCSEVWGVTHAKYLDKVVKLQKKSYSYNV